MFSVALLQKFEKAEALLAQNASEEAVAILDSLRQHEVVSGTADQIQFLGRLAQGYRRAGATEKELPVLERLCRLAVDELKGLRNLATDDDIQATAADLAYLARAYRKV